MFVWFLIWTVSAFTWNEEQKTFFLENGYIGPISFISEEEAQAISEELLTVPKYFAKAPEPGEPKYWSKNILFRIPMIVELGQREEILSFLQPILGPNILLWGTELIKKPPGVHHRWHVDIEHTGWDGLTIWLPLRHVSLESTILFIPGSHKYGLIPQTREREIDLKMDEEVLKYAESLDSGAKIIAIDMRPGQFVIFAGRMWHRTVNYSSHTRHALLFQYCRTDAFVKIPRNYSLPTIWSEAKPWVIKIAGEDTFGLNYLH